MRIGDFQLKEPFIAAPLAGITDASTRTINSEMGAALCCSEMVSAKGLLYGNVKTEELLYISGDEGPVAFQIFGGEPEVIRETAARLSERDNVILDINMGCPVPKVVRNGEGSALMKTPELAGEVIKAAVDGTAGAKPVTVKIRAGWDAGHINAPEIAVIAEEAGASAVTVHGRTRAQMYSGSADRSVIKKVKESTDIPVIGNGDIYSAADALAMMEETGCDAVMIGRGMLGDPWIFRELSAAWRGEPAPEKPSRAEIYGMILRHFDMLAGLKGEKRAFPEMKKHIAWYMKGMRGAGAVKRRVNTAGSAEEMREILREFFEADPDCRG